MGSLQEIRKTEDGEKSPSDNYNCYRLQAGVPSSLSSSTSNLQPPTSSTRDLYGIVKDACAQQNIKWPVECQVVEDKVHHLEDSPLYPEAFYEPTGTELRPQPVGDELGRIVYQYYPTSSVNYFSRSCVGGNKFLNEDVRPPLEHESDTTLQFESRFECGNLAKVVQVSECYYELHLRADMYTSRHTQWFYFAVSNTRKDITYRFSVVNLTKGDSLYNHGMRPLLYSKREANTHGVGWRRCATNIVYFKNHDSSDNTCFDSEDECEDDSAPSYTLTFNVTFPHDNDTVYIAHCYPYSYSDLQEHLLSIQRDSFKASVCRQRVLCRSLAGNPVYLLTITSHETDDDTKKKRAVVLTARVHPGETPSSWIMKGIIDFLTSDNPKANELRGQFIFKVVPMLNPDGVIVGNHRCSLVGRDLNRQYKMVVKEMFPAIWHTKAMIRRLMDEYGVVMYGDFHAHSRKHNIFIYGCENRRNQDNHLREQIFPLLLHYNGGDKFSFRSCKFKVHRCKEGTARVVIWMMGVLHSYTMEASFGGCCEGPRSGTHYTSHDFLSMGKQFCETLFEYFDPQPIKEKLRNKLWSRLIKKGSSADEPASIDFSETNSSSDDSENRPSGEASVRMRKKKIIRHHPRKKTTTTSGGRSTSVAQVVEKVTTQMRMDRSERRSRSLHASTRSVSCGSPVTERLTRHTNNHTVTSSSSCSGCVDVNDDTHTHTNTHSTNSKHYCQHTVTSAGPKRTSTHTHASISTSALDLHQNLNQNTKTSLRPTHYRLEDSLPTPCSAPTIRRSTNTLIRPPINSPTTTTTITSSSSSSTTTMGQRDSIPSSPSPSERQEGVCEGEVRDYQDSRILSESHTKSYMERMGEIMATRLAISDTEDGSVSTWWGEGDFGGRLLPPHPSVRRLEALEPVIAKTRLHDPRRPQSRPHAPRTQQQQQQQSALYSSVRTAHVAHRSASHLHRLNRREKYTENALTVPRKKGHKNAKDYSDKSICFDSGVGGISSSRSGSGSSSREIVAATIAVATTTSTVPLPPPPDPSLKQHSGSHTHTSTTATTITPPYNNHLHTTTTTTTTTIITPPQRQTQHNNYNDNYDWMRERAGELINTTTRSQSVNNNGHLVTYLHYSKPSHLDMGPCDDLRSNGELSLSLSVPRIPRAASAGSLRYEGSSGRSPCASVLKYEDTGSNGFSPSTSTLRYEGSGGSSFSPSASHRVVNRRRSNINKSLSQRDDVDADQLCADIANCDTLFLDTCAQETPELLAARNLKGKIKKKKSTKMSTTPIAANTTKEADAEGRKLKETEAGGEAGDRETVVGGNASTFVPSPPDGKVKKKIKIVIGKKNKTKISKKTPDRDT